MSAIGAIIYSRERPALSQKIAEMMAAMTLSPPKPDSCQFWSKNNVALVCIQREITNEDSMKQQPIIDPESGLTLVADIRLDNRETLGHQLGITSNELNSFSDAALVLEAYKCFGQQCVHKLLGDFTFIVWDQNDQTLFCARDHTGKRQLYFIQDNNFIAFASLTRGLHAVSDKSKILNESKLLAFIANSRITKPLSYYQHVRILAPAHCMTVKSGSITEQCYWQPDLSHTIKRQSDHEYYEEFRALLDNAVECRLRSCKRIGSFLSGGLDSSTVSGIAHQMLQKRHSGLITYSSVPQKLMTGEEFPLFFADDRHYINAFTEYYPDIQSHLITIEDRDLFSHTKRFFDWFRQPVTGGFNRLWVDKAIELAQANNVNVFLLGQNGDNTISWEAKAYYSGLIKQGRCIKAYEELRALSKFSKKPMKLLMKKHILLPFLPRYLLNHLYPKISGFNQNNSLLINPKHHAFIANDQSNRLPFRLDTQGCRQWRWQRIGLGQHCLYTDYLSGFGIEFRDPTADKRLIEFCLQLPESINMVNGLPKNVIRQSTIDLLPDKIRLRNNKGPQSQDCFIVLSKMGKSITDEIQLLSQSETVKHMINLNYLNHLAKTDWTSHQNIRKKMYQSNLLVKGLLVGKFLYWHDENL